MKTLGYDKACPRACSPFIPQRVTNADLLQILNSVTLKSKHLTWRFSYIFGTAYRERERERERERVLDRQAGGFPLLAIKLHKQTKNV